MKSLRILFSVLFVMSLATACDDGDKKTTKSEICNDNIDNDGDGRTDCQDTADCSTAANCQTAQENCSNGIDDDGDTLVDCADPNCATAANCQTAQENCTNGVDDDGDNQIDCNDSDCATHASCQTTGCTLDTLFFDSPATCDAGFQCSVNDTYAATCQPDAMFAGGTFYGACGTNGECPFGSLCAGTSAEDSSCMPFCNSDTHPTCPQGGQCMYSLGTSGLDLCDLPDNCNPVTNDGCDPGDGCYIISQAGDTTCAGAGTGAVGSSCTYVNDCAPTLVCGGNPGQCYQMCDAQNPCATGTCNTQAGLPNGWGVCQ